MGRAWPPLIMLAACQFVASWASLSIIGVTVEMRDGLAVSAAAIAGLVAAYSATQAVAAPAVQILIGHWARRGVLVGSLTIVGGSCLLLAAAPSYEVALAARVLMAVGAAAIMPTAAATAASLVPEDRRPAALAIVLSGLTIATVAALPISSFLGQTLGWRSAWAAAGIGALLAAPAAFALTPKDSRGACTSLSAMIALMGMRATGLTVATTFVLLAGGFVTYSLLALWMTEAGGAARETLPPVFLGLGVAAVIGNAVAPRLIRAIGRDGTITTALGLNLASLVALWLEPTTAALVYPAMFVFSASWALAISPIQARLVALTPDRAQLALALNASAFFTGQALGGFAAGQVYETAGAVALPLASAVVMVASLFVFRLAAAPARQPA